MIIQNKIYVFNINKFIFKMEINMSVQSDELDYRNYIIDPALKIKDVRQGGRFNAFKIITYDDGSEWVLLNNPLRDRFCGYLFLKNALELSNIQNVEAAENRMALNDKTVIYLSKYCGEVKPDILERFEDTAAVRRIGYRDLDGYTNLREKDGTIYIFDTEKTSFKKPLREEIDSFGPLHDKIRDFLENFEARNNLEDKKNSGDRKNSENRKGLIVRHKTSIAFVVGALTAVGAIYLGSKRTEISSYISGLLS